MTPFFSLLKIECKIILLDFIYKKHTISKKHKKTKKMGNFKKGFFYLIGDKDQEELVVIDESELYWIDSNLQRKPLIKSLKSNELNRDEALNAANEKISYLKQIIKDLELHEADQRGDEKKNINMLKKKINNLKKFKKNFLF